MNTAIIVDDEMAARKRLHQLLREHADVIQVIDEAENGNEAIEKINRLKPDIVFLDIQMPEISGIELVNFLDHSPHIVFVTAHHAYAIKAFEQNSLDYLLKPVEAERLALTISRLQAAEKKPNLQLHLFNEMMKQLQGIPKLDSIPVKYANKIILVAIENVIYFEAKDKYVFIHTYEEHHLIDATLTYLEDRLPDSFIRIHRTFIVNRKKIKEIHKHLKGSFLFVMLNKTQSKLTSGNTYYDEIKKLLNL